MTSRNYRPAPFIDALLAAQRIISVESNLPDAIFAPEFTEFSACDIASTFSGSFAEVLNHLSVSFGDSSCLLIAIDPPASSLRDCSLDAAVEIGLPISTSEYWEILSNPSGTNPSDCLAFALRKCAIIGSSKSWVCWSDRDYELSIVASTHQIQVSTAEVGFASVLETLNQALLIGGGSLPAHEYEAFARNYG